jgi:hypothetical protein
VLPALVQVPFDAGKEQTRFALIRNNTGKPIKLSEPTCSDKEIGVELSEPTSNLSFRVTIKVPAGHKIEEGTQITIHSDAEGAETLTLPISQIMRIGRATPPVARGTGPRPVSPGGAGQVNPAGR